MTAPIIKIQEIKDGYVQENFKRLRNFLEMDAVTRCDFKFVEIPVAAAGVDIPFRHNMGYRPIDIITMHNFSNATVTFNFAMFTATDLYLTSSGSTTLRLLVGRYV